MHAYRSDLADLALAGSLFAPHYARAEVRSCQAATTPLRSAPAEGATAVSELIRGEPFVIIDVAGPWAWGYTQHDHYVGYARLEALGEHIDATHVVGGLAALVFASPSIKAPVYARLPMGARLAGTVDGDFLVLDQGFVHHRHVRPLDAPAADPVAVALSLVGAPYRWGGRSGDGLDCSGLVQLAHAFAGAALPRDSDQQAGTGRPLGSGEPLRRGDLVFFPGHVGIMADEANLVHANAYWMAVTVEPLADVLARGAAITATRRL